MADSVSWDRCTVDGVSKDSYTLQISGLIIESGVGLLEPQRLHESTMNLTPEFFDQGVD